MVGIEIVVFVDFDEFSVGISCGFTTRLRRATGVRSSGIARGTVAFTGSTATPSATAASTTSAALLFFFAAASPFGVRRALAERFVVGRSKFALQNVLFFLQSVAEVVEFAPSRTDCRSRFANGFAERFPASRFVARFTTRRSCGLDGFGTRKRFGAECRLATRAIF